MTPISSKGLPFNFIVPFTESTEILQVFVLELQCFELLLCFIKSVNGEVARRLKVKNLHLWPGFTLVAMCLRRRVVLCISALRRIRTFAPVCRACQVVDMLDLLFYLFHPLHCQIGDDFLQRQQLFPLNFFALIGYRIGLVLQASDLEQVELQVHVACARDAISVKEELTPFFELIVWYDFLVTRSIIKASKKGDPLTINLILYVELRLHVVGISELPHGADDELLVALKTV